jgi:hypothetical protein
MKKTQRTILWVDDNPQNNNKEVRKRKEGKGGIGGKRRKEEGRGGKRRKRRADRERKSVRTTLG